MPRKRIELELVGKLTPRERLWQAARKLREFTLLEWQDAVVPVVNLETTETYLRCLKAGGYLEPVEERRKKRADEPGRHGFAEMRYRLIKDSIDAPRVDEQGKQVTQGMGTLAMWRAMKALKEFDWHEIHRAANLPPTDKHPGLTVSKETAKTYVAQLAKAGYFKQLRAPLPRVRLGTLPARFRLVRDTGALPPAITRRDGIYDRNLGEFTYQQAEQEVVDAIQ